MAFSATVNNVQYIGPAKRQLSGTWTGSAGDAAGSMSVSGTVVSAKFQKMDADNTFQGDARCSVSTTSGITTLTIQNQDNVVNGFFTLDILGS
jgi:hypothetical protein